MTGSGIFADGEKAGPARHPALAVERDATCVYRKLKLGRSGGEVLKSAKDGV
jgi:hypothetical protein